MKAVFFDRDGVLNKSLLDQEGKPLAPRRLEDFLVYDEIRPVVNYIISKGFLALVVTNQPDVGNGLVSSSVVDQMNQILVEKLGITEVFSCMHSQSDQCDCRKPGIGMFLKAKSKFGLDLNNCIMVGDRYGDMLGARRAGIIEKVFIDYGYLESLEYNFESCEPMVKISTMKNLMQALISLGI